MRQKTRVELREGYGQVNGPLGVYHFTFMLGAGSY